MYWGAERSGDIVRFREFLRCVVSLRTQPFLLIISAREGFVGFSVSVVSLRHFVLLLWVRVSVVGVGFRALCNFALKLWRWGILSLFD